MTRFLTEDDKHLAFVRATGGFSKAAERWRARAIQGLNDAELAKALEYELGIEGGASATDNIPAYHVKGAGLQVWVSWDFPGIHQEKPAFKSAATIAKAREVYGIPDPSQPQLSLF
jgi:hypothetical protein